MTYKQGWPWGGGGSFFCSVLAYSRKTLHDLFSALLEPLVAGICFTPRLTVVRVVQLC